MKTINTRFFILGLLMLTNTMQSSQAMFSCCCSRSSAKEKKVENLNSNAEFRRARHALRVPTRVAAPAPAAATTEPAAAPAAPAAAPSVDTIAFKATIGTTPLYYALEGFYFHNNNRAIQNKYLDRIELLISRNASINAGDIVNTFQKIHQQQSPQDFIGWCVCALEIVLYKINLPSQTPSIRKAIGEFRILKQ
jgi:hypothetical protein